jgi:CRP-like cAMP-binding protein
MAHHREPSSLGRTELFLGAPEPALREALESSFRKHVPAGEALLRQDEAATMLYLVIAGRLRATQTTQDGQQIIIRYIGPDEVAGYAALTEADNHSSSVVAVDDCHLMGWSRAAIKQIMLRHPVIAMNAVTVLGARYREMQVRLRELSTEKVERRVAHTLLRLAERAGRRSALGVEIAFPLTRQDLAEMSGTTLHTVSRTLSAWEEQGIVDSGRRRVILRNPRALMAIADELET